MYREVPEDLSGEEQWKKYEEIALKKAKITQRTVGKVFKKFDVSPKKNFSSVRCLF